MVFRIRLRHIAAARGYCHAVACRSFWRRVEVRREVWDEVCGALSGLCGCIGRRYVLKVNGEVKGQWGA